VYYVRPGGEILWLGSQNTLNWSWWRNCTQGSATNVTKLPVYISLSTGDSCRLHAAASGQGWGGPCTDSLSLLVIAHPGAWGHCHATLSLNGSALLPGAIATIPTAGVYTASVTVRSEWRYGTNYQLNWSLLDPTSANGQYPSQSLSSATSFGLPLTQPGFYTLTIMYFVYEQASSGCEDTLRYFIQVLRDSVGSNCPTNFPDTLQLPLGNHTLTFPIGYTTALYTWTLQGLSGQQSGATGGSDTIRAIVQLTSPGWHFLQVYFYSPTGQGCQVYIPIYVRPPTVRPCVSTTVRPFKPLLTIGNTTLPPNPTGTYTLCSGRNYAICASPSGGHCPGLLYSWGYTLLSSGTQVGGPFYQSCDTLRIPSSTFSIGLLSFWMIVRDSLSNVVCRDSSFLLVDIGPNYCGHPDSMSLSVGDSTYWPGDTLYHTPPDTVIGYSVPTPISDSLHYGWQWSITPIGGSVPIANGTSNLIPISLPTGGYVLQITSQSQPHQRTRQYSFYIHTRVSTLSAGSSKASLLYPNPTTSTFYVEVPNGGPRMLYVVDATGREVLRASLQEERLNVFSLPAGLYIIRLGGTTEPQLYQLLVQS
jgi:hypothetical protein